ncbi:MAG: 30S ribosomal protein S4 [Thermoanaerobaculaceae bacterium]|nr:30S ribosomal protein S4 [Thermoanaerobaculaceae bacterium]MDI9622305.1 30S ribosomal protein S4 [Acidobacteriota bacterium]NLH10619.1 30S ribosomal protein S4 [Holophagae bacterium]HPW55059.1 30S ribosomal protein S4 [Thermoanaerobaculaceae bacterium]
MARYHEPVCRLCRREGMKLFLKGERCFKEKCAVERRSYAPGQHGKRRNKMQPYGLQLREKQKVRRVYGVLERQFRRYFAEANRQKGVTGENLLRLLETRLDNVVYSLGFASSRSQARQLVRHGHVTVDGRRVNLPSFRVKPGMEVALKEDVRTNAFVVEALETAQGRGVPPWLELDSANFRGKVVALPTREDIRLPIQEQLIVELYSR